MKDKLSIELLPAPATSNSGNSNSTARRGSGYGRGYIHATRAADIAIFNLVFGTYNVCEQIEKKGRTAGGTIDTARARRKNGKPNGMGIVLTMSLRK